MIKSILCILFCLFFYSEILECTITLKPDFSAPIVRKSILNNYVEFLTIEDLLVCQILVESDNNPCAINIEESAYGKLQIRPCLLKDYNIRTHSNYKIDQMFIDSIAIKIYVFYAKKCKSKEEIARRWNGGPKGLYKQSTEKYWKKVNSKLKHHNYEAIYHSIYPINNKRINFETDINGWNIEQKENISPLSEIKRI
jgi:hypothetical protein